MVAALIMAAGYKAAHRFRQVVLVIPGWSEGPDPESRGYAAEIPGSR
jgi:hypothetical protein